MNYFTDKDLDILPHKIIFDTELPLAAKSIYLIMFNTENQRCSVEDLVLVSSEKDTKKILKTIRILIRKKYVKHLKNNIFEVVQ